MFLLFYYYLENASLEQSAVKIQINKAQIYQTLQSFYKLNIVIKITNSLEPSEILSD